MGQNDLQESINEKPKRKKQPIVANVIIDTRENKPWDFNIKLPSNLSLGTLSQKLNAGDYSLIGYSDPAIDKTTLIIERKNSLEEFLGNIGKNYDRFVRELELLSAYTYPLIIIEDDLRSAYARFQKSAYFNLPPEYVIKRINEFYFDYGVTTLFLSNRTIAQKYVLNFFKYFLVKHGQES